MTGRAARVGVALLAVALAACDAESPTASPTQAPAPEPTPVTTVYQLDTTVWYAGLVMTFGTATAVLDARGGSLTVELRLENPGTDDLTLDSPIRLVAGDASIEPTRESVLPSVVAGTTGYTTLTFDIIGRSSVDDAVLRVGTPDLHEAIVPLRPGKVAAVTLKPVGLALGGRANASDLRLVLTGGLLRWDLPDWGDELPGSSASLTLTYDVTYRGTFSGGFPFTGDDIALRLPDGTVIGPRADGRSQTIGVIGPGQTLAGASTRFEIPAHLGGTYQLVLVNGSAKATIKIVLPS